MRIKNWVLDGCSGLLENGIGVGRKLHIHTFLFETGKFFAIMDGCQSFPHENCN